MARKPKNRSPDAQNDNGEVPTTPPSNDPAHDDFPSPLWGLLTPEQRDLTQYVRFVDAGKTHQNSVLPGKTLLFMDSDNTVKEYLTDWPIYAVSDLGVMFGAGLCFAECRGEGKRGPIRRVQLMLTGPDRAQLQAQLTAKFTAQNTPAPPSPGIGISTLNIATFGQIPFPEGGYTERERVIMLAAAQQVYMLEQIQRRSDERFDRIQEKRVEDTKEFASQITTLRKEFSDQIGFVLDRAFQTVERAIKHTSKNGGKQMSRIFRDFSKTQMEESSETKKDLRKVREKYDELKHKKDKKDKVLEYILAIKELAPDVKETVKMALDARDKAEDKQAEAIAEQIFQKEQAEKAQLQAQQAQQLVPVVPPVQPPPPPADFDPNAPAQTTDTSYPEPPQQ